MAYAHNKPNAAEYHFGSIFIWFNVSSTKSKSRFIAICKNINSYVRMNSGESFAVPAPHLSMFCQIALAA